MLFVAAILERRLFAQWCEHAACVPDRDLASRALWIAYFSTLLAGTARAMTSNPQRWPMKRTCNSLKACSCSQARDNYAGRGPRFRRARRFGERLSAFLSTGVIGSWRRFPPHLPADHSVDRKGGVHPDTRSAIGILSPVITKPTIQSISRCPRAAPSRAKRDDLGCG